MATCRNIIK